MWPGQVEDTCQKCGERPATNWYSAEGVIAAVHGAVAAWCMHCILTEQVKICREAAARLPELEAELEALKAAEKP